MNKFSESSLEKLKTCHEDLQALFLEVIQHYDCTILCGYRSKEDQEKAEREGFSKVVYPNSKHNKKPSKAIDVIKYPIDWNDTRSLYHFAGFVMGTAASMGIKIRWGGDFNKDLNLKNDSFVDVPHFELIE